MLAGLYPICDVDSLERVGVAPLAFVEAVLEARPALLQLRAKSWPRERVRALAQSLLPRMGEVPLVINDDVTLARELGAWLHVGQGDATELPGIAHFGRSTHTLAQLEQALTEHPTYVAYGPVYPTRSKQNPDPCVGIEGLTAARARAGTTPLCAIGGIDRDRLREVAKYTDLIAVIGALVHPEIAEIRARALEFSEIVAEARSCC